MGAAFLKGVSGGESGGVVIVVLVVALVLAGDVPVPVVAEVAVGGDGAQPEDGLGSLQAPAGAGDAHPVLDEVAAGAFDDAGGDRPAVRQGGGVVQAGLLGVQVARGGADDLGVLAAGPGRVGGGRCRDRGGDLGCPAVQDGQACAVTQSSAAGSRAGWKHQAAFHRYSMTWMKSITIVTVMPRLAASARMTLIWWLSPSASAIQARS